MTDKATPTQIDAAVRCLQEANRLIEAGNNEQVIRDHFTSNLHSLFPGAPSWIAEHVRGGEAALKIIRDEKASVGFVDNLIGLTPIEYEANLLDGRKFSEGLRQVKSYCASLVNEGNDTNQIIGVLSDTVRWRAYRVEVKPGKKEGVEGTDIDLIEIDSVDASTASETDALRLLEFLLKYVQRLGSRPLDAESVAYDLGFESPFCVGHLEILGEVVAHAFTARPEYGELIKGLWCNFVSYVIAKGRTTEFDLDEYTRELYILTLAKFICANAITGRSLISDDDELQQILNGDFFTARGLTNFVEYDYFGWINGPISSPSLLAAARDIQRDLRAYDFSHAPDEDVFGQLMAQLAERSKRILLGQEWTPSWVARALVRKTIQALPEGEQPRFVDMSCGSGAMILEVVRQVKERLSSNQEGADAKSRIDLLSQAVTGFDIDPLAVMLSKIGWVLSAKDWLEPFGAHQVTIPVYHADSLFATTPLSRESSTDDEVVRLHLAEHVVDLPTHLLSPGWQSVFDAIIDRAYAIATQETTPILTDSEVHKIVIEVTSLAPRELKREEIVASSQFLRDLIQKIHILNAQGRNGIWAFILRNSYRPGLVAGQFNGLVSNPPWLALSKIADNPYTEALKHLAGMLGIRPEGPSFLHTDMSTVFLLRSVDRFLGDNAVFGCIVPETVLNGHQHNLFRANGFVDAKRPIALDICEIWKIDEHAFKNRAAILFGVKRSPRNLDPIPGGFLRREGSVETLQFHRVDLGARTVWTERRVENASSLFHPAEFEQGADIMPRRLFFHDVQATDDPTLVSLAPIDEGTSQKAYLTKDAKQCKRFKLPTPCIVPEKHLYDVLISKMLSPFVVAQPAKAFLPITRNEAREWGPLSQFDLSQSAADEPALRAFGLIAKEIGKLDGLKAGQHFSGMWDRLNFRNKIGKQSGLSDQGFLVLTGAGGSDICAALLDLSAIESARLLIDQTLYWAPVSTEDEALYLTGLLNSNAANELIKAFQPRGQQGERHIHELAFGITPPYDPEEESHVAVVRATRTLLGEYVALIEANRDLDDSFVRWLDPGKSLARRRSVLRKTIEKLPSYRAYSSACSAVYGTT